jgi:hypothetical protein
MIWQATLAHKAGLSPAAAILAGITAGLFVFWLALRFKRPTLLLGL